MGKQYLVSILALSACGRPNTPAVAAPSAASMVIEWIHEFTRTEGNSVRGAFVELNGRFYGMAGELGPNATADCNSTASWQTVEHTRHCPGSLISVGLAGDLRVEHAFSPLDDTYRNADGYHPYGSLVLSSDGWLYGVTQMGGTPAISGAKGAGVLFRYRDNAFETLHSFFSEPRSADGLYPMGRPAVLPDGRVCGSAKNGGDSGNGAVWCWSVDGFRFAPMPSPAGENTGGVVYAGGLLHGVTNGAGAYGAGAYFRFDPDSLEVAIVDSFAAYTMNAHGDDNATIQAPLVLRDGRLLVARQYGGPYGTGLVAELRPTGIVVLKTFEDIPLAAVPRFGNSTGGMPNGQLAEGCDGMVYGTTMYGGAAGTGALYRIASDGTRFEILASLPSYPYGGLVRAGDCALWGTTFVKGKVFRVVNK